MTNTLHVNELRRNVGEVLDRVSRGERLIITRFGRPTAALVPLSDLERLETAMTVTVYPAQVNENLRREFPARALANIAEEWARGDIVLAIRLLADAVALTAVEAQVKMAGDHK